MSNKHSRGVTKNRLKAQQSVEEGYWDDFSVEHEYYENDTCPVGPYPDEKGRVKGEFDVILYNFDDKTAYYIEVKSNYNDLGKAEEQLERAEKHFAPDWEVIGSTWLER